MRRAVIVFLSIVCGSAFAQQPATRPAAAERPPINVLLLRFDQLDQTAGMQWVGRAVQQALLAESVRLRMLQPITPNEETLTNRSTTDQSVAHRMGGEAGADYVIYGSYQNVENELRLTGSILDVGTGKIVGGLKATGASRDLFALQDQLSDQMKRQMLAIYAPPATQPSIAAAPPIVIYPPQTTIQDPTMSRPFDGSTLQQSLRYRGSIYENYKSDRERNMRQNYYYSYPNAYYGGWSGGYSLTPWWGVRPYYGRPGPRLPAQMQHAR